MSKAILIMDMPQHCIDCPCHFADDEGAVICGKENKELITDDIQTYKPDWCPIRELPKKKPERTLTSLRKTVSTSRFKECDLNIGWNACLDAITGEVQE